MNRIDEVKPESFFAAFLLPLRRANMRRGVRYLRLGREPASGWGPVVSRTGGIEKLPPGGASAEAMLERLQRHWVAEGDANLRKLAPFLFALRRAIVAPRATKPADPKPPDFVYPLF
jgi:hypothetical protein